MNEEKDNVFEEYVNAFKKLNIEDKEKEIIELLNENAKAMCKLLEINGMKHEEDLNIINRQSDFLDKVVVYLNVNRELLAKYIEKKEGEE